MTVAQILEVVHGLMNTVKVAMNGAQRLLSAVLWVRTNGIWVLPCRC